MSARLRFDVGVVVTYPAGGRDYHEYGVIVDRNGLTGNWVVLWPECGDIDEITADGSCKELELNGQRITSQGTIVNAARLRECRRLARTSIDDYVAPSWSLT